MQKTAAALKRHVGQPVTLVERANIRSEVGSATYHGAMVDPLGAGMHVGQLGHEMGRLAAEAGTTIHEQAEVYDLTRLGSSTADDLKTTRGDVRAGKVILGTSG